MSERLVILSRRWASEAGDLFPGWSSAPEGAALTGCGHITMLLVDEAIDQSSEWFQRAVVARLRIGAEVRTVCPAAVRSSDRLYGAHLSRAHLRETFSGGPPDRMMGALLAMAEVELERARSYPKRNAHAAAEVHARMLNAR